MKILYDHLKCMLLLLVLSGVKPRSNTILLRPKVKSFISESKLDLLSEINLFFYNRFFVPALKFS
ncbi:hypothetical protein [Treponema succinifaciens]|uniref:hypothetical protein n=1 Tax=Treponema succinifaciens TaxID=167 RepID=UPI0011D1153D|nr:hypothetical protein [Treponema succinifaciens]